MNIPEIAPKGRQLVSDIDRDCPRAGNGLAVQICRFVILVSVWQQVQVFGEPVIILLARSTGKIDGKQVVGHIAGLTVGVVIIADIAGQGCIGAVRPGFAVIDQRAAVQVAADDRAGPGAVGNRNALAETAGQVLRDILRIHVDLSEPGIAAGQFIGDQKFNGAGAVHLGCIFGVNDPNAIDLFERIVHLAVPQCHVKVILSCIAGQQRVSAVVIGIPSGVRIHIAIIVQRAAEGHILVIDCRDDGFN